MARRVEQVERPVAKEVVRGEVACLEQCRVGEGDLAHLASAKVLLGDGGVRVGRVAGPNGVPEARPDDEFRAGGECGGVADVIKVIMA